MGISLDVRQRGKGKYSERRGNPSEAIKPENKVKVGAWNAAESATQNFEISQ